MEIVYLDETPSLAHHGIKGQKWGVRRFQNLDGSLTEAGRKRYQKTLAKQFKKDLRAYSSFRHDPNSNVYERSSESEYFRKPKSGTIYEQLHNELSDAREELRERTQVIADFNNNEELVTKYRLKAAKKYFDSLDIPDKDEKLLESIEDWYLNDDGDQGSGNSFEIYCKETGKDYNRIVEDEIQAHKDYHKACEKVVNKLLGEFGNEVIDERNNKTISQKVSDVLLDLGEDEVDYLEGHFLPG